MADIDIHEIIRNITSSERYRTNSHFSQRVYEDEPILTTARQMSSYLPDEYKKMRAISRWQEGKNGRRGRWLTDAELFYRQALIMADFEDDCPYNGVFKAFFPTYNAMSDRQLRGYFTWRAQVRRGHVEETSLSFAYVYLYELLCGIGVANPEDGYHKIESFWQSYSLYAPELDRYVRVWLLDYAIYHGLSPELLSDNKIVTFDQALIALKRAQDTAMHQAQLATARSGQTKKTSRNVNLDTETEEALFTAIDELSTYHIANSRFAKEYREDVRYVACNTYLQLVEHYAKRRKLGLLEGLFGEQMRLPYTMFGSAVFFDPLRHPDCTYELDEIHRYRCERGLWTCERFYGSRARSATLGSIVRAVDRIMRETWGYPHPLKDESAPKYITKIIERAATERYAWAEAHKPVEVHIDLSSLRGIRAAAARSREALLTDEEREDEPQSCAEAEQEASSKPSCDAQRAVSEYPPAPNTASTGSVVVNAPAPMPQQADLTEQQPTDRPLTAPQTAYLAALLAQDAQAAAAALQNESVSEDMMVDTINESLFDSIGDTVIEYSENGPAIIEDYREDVEGILQDA